MDIETADGYGSKRVHHRLGPASHPSASSAGGDRYNKVCFHWRAGRCNRHPCPYLHAEVPQSHDSVSRPHGGLVWRKPNTAGNTGPASNWGKGRPGSVNGAIPRPQVNKICNYFVSGNCSYGERCKYLHSWFVSDSFSLLTSLEGHQKAVTGIALPSGSNQLYTGSQDETVRVWDCQSGQCARAVNMGAQVGCVISEGPWIFVGITNFVKAWNMQTGTELSLDGPIGQVYALVVGNDMLFAGTQDGRILAWKPNAVTNSFEPAAVLEGHRRSVVSFVVGAGRLYSSSMDKTVRVWDLTTLQCLQTLTGHTDVVMSVLCWDAFLLTASLDNTIKVWAATESGNLEVTYTHNEEKGVLLLCGMYDGEAKPVLFCACNDNTIRLYDLPSFGERGKIFSKKEIRSIQIGPGIFFTGDATGDLKVWKWNTKEAESAPHQ